MLNRIKLLASQDIANSYVIIILITAFGFQLVYPITLTDSDMWYHLRSGQEFWENLKISTSAPFSFLEPERSFSNYYWGFQALIALVYEYGGYYGLVIMRAILFTLPALMAYLYIKAENKSPFIPVALLVLFIFYFTLLFGKSINLRPHLFSYFFILTILYILERRPQYAFTLPGILLIWVNIHGVEYVVPTLIGGAYFTEFLVQKYYRNINAPEHDWKYGLSILACIPVLFMTPFGTDIFLAPFSTAPYQHLYITEMFSISWESFYSVGISLDNLNMNTVFPLLSALSLVAIIRSVYGRYIRLSHSLMAAGGIFLLFQGYRLLWEWSLLIFPLVTHFIGKNYASNSIKTSNISTKIILLLILALPLVNLYKRLPEGKSYPIDIKSLPNDSSEFLNTINTGGNVLSSGLYNGYLEWSLNNNYKIHSDFQLSLFNDIDVYQLLHVFKNKEVLQQLDKQYGIDYILANYQQKTFSRFIKELPDFVPILITDKGVLYVNKSTQPTIADRYEIKNLNPYELTNVENEEQLDEHLEALISANQSLPHAEKTTEAIVRLLFNNKRYKEALPWAKKFLNDHPENPNSHYLLGIVYEALKEYPKAIPYFWASKELNTSASFENSLYRHIGTCHYELKEFDAAYNYLWEGVNPFLGNTRYVYLYQLAYSAYIEGHTNEALMLLRMLLMILPENNELSGKSEDMLQKLLTAEQELPSFFEWAKNQLLPD